MIIEGLFGVRAPLHRSGTRVTGEDREWLQSRIEDIVALSLDKAAGKGMKKIKKAAGDVYFMVLAKAGSVYFSSSKMRELACAAQALFLVNALSVSKKKAA